MSAGFREEGKVGYTAVSLLDLAILHAEAKRPAETLEAAAEALPLLESLGLKDEALVTQRLLKEAVEAKAVTLGVLWQVRDQVSGGGGIPQRSEGPTGPP